MADQRNTAGKESPAQLAGILLAQQDAIRQVLELSKVLVDQPGDFDVEALEELLRQRNNQIEYIQSLEAERQQLSGNAQDAAADDINVIEGETRKYLDDLAVLDRRLARMIEAKRSWIIKQMATAPKFVNFMANSWGEPQQQSRVFDVTR